MSAVTISPPRPRAGHKADIDQPGAPAAGRRPSSPFERQVPASQLRSEMSGMTEAPGKVWFWELAAAVIDAGRCVQCGACVAACPTDSIGVGSDNLPKLVKMCTGCSLCWDFCPRGGLRYEATWLDAEGASDTVGPGARTPIDDWWQLAVPAAESAAETEVATAMAPDRPAIPRIHRRDLGKTLRQAAVKVDPRSKLYSQNAQDGGVVTAILLASLAAGEIDGAVVAREDPDHPWKGVPHLATTPQEIHDAAGSFYSQTMALSRLDAATAGLGPRARIAVVGTPCEIEGIRALQARRWRRGASHVDSVVLTIALLCTKNFDYEALMVGELQERRGLDLRQVGKVDVIHGRMVVEDRAGAELVNEPVKRFHSAALKGCDECADFLGRAADISVGSVGSAPGYSSVLVRTAAGARAVGLLERELEFAELPAPDALEKLDQMDRTIAAGALARDLDPSGELFIDFADHLVAYSGTDRAPIWRS